MNISESTTKLDVLKQIEIGERVAEEEADQLEQYFVETDQWQQMISGKIDVVYGPKGSGKSALYTLLNRKDGELFDKGILIASAENVRGETVFSSIIAEPPPSELSFVYLWKIYGLVIIARALRDFSVRNEHAEALVDSLSKSGLLPPTDSLATLFRAATTYFKAWISRDAKSVEYALGMDPTTQMPTISRKTEFADQTEEQNLHDIPVAELYEAANTALETADINLWLLFDRLDVAFAESPALERNALRALFRAYNDLKAYPRISLKIFVRDDIWKRITSGGFTEASHITKAVNISWTSEGLLNLVMLRLLSNPAFVEYAGCDPDQIKADLSKQKDLFYALVPEKVDTGRNPDTFDWILSRTTDSSGSSVPREVIHLLDAAREEQIRQLERGAEEPDGTRLLDRPALKAALPLVSKVRYEQTLLAEYPDMAPYLNQLDGQKAEQNAISLAGIWKVDEEEAQELAKNLAEIGFFEVRGPNSDQTYWVPFIYRGALNLVQGKADP